MTPAHIDHFTARGCLRLEGFHPARRVAPLRQALRDELKRLTTHKGTAGGGKGMPAALQGLPVFQQIGKLSSLVKAPGLHEALMTPELMDCIARLGGPKRRPGDGTQLLLSPPHQGAWTLQGLNWHVDIAAGPEGPPPGIQAFFLIDDVAPQGGATLALAGSHRAPSRRSGAAGSSPSSSSPLREALRSATDLPQRLHALGIDLVEMCGRAGDVFLMDMRVLHTPSVNASKHVRMMATCRCLRQAEGERP